MTDQADDGTDDVRRFVTTHTYSGEALHLIPRSGVMLRRIWVDAELVWESPEAQG